MKSFTHFAQAPKGLDLETVQRLLEDLLSKYQDNREALLPPFTTNEVSQSLTFAGQGLSLADKKLKVGCTFGSEKEKRGGKFKVENKIYCKLFTLGEGADERLMVQESWINPLMSFYGTPQQIGDIFKGHPQQGVLQERSAPIIAAIADLFKRVEKIIDTAKAKKAEKAYHSFELQIAEKAQKLRWTTKARSLPGPVLLSLIPQDLQREYALQIVDAWLRGAAQKYSSGNTKHLARFYILQDHYPYVWKKPSGSRLELAYPQAERGSLLGFERETNLVWDSEADKEEVLASYLDFAKDDEGKILTQRVSVLNEEGEWEQKKVPRLVLKPDASPSYSLELDQVEQTLESHDENIRLQIAARVFLGQTPEEPKEPKTRTVATHLIKTIREKLGSFFDTAKRESTFAGKVLYLTVLKNPLYRKTLEELVALAKDFSKAPKADKASILETIRQKAKQSLIETFPEGIPEANLINEIVQTYVFCHRVNLEESLEINPKQIYDQHDLIPSNARTATVLTQHNDELTALNISTIPNPFYAPKLWPEGRMMGKAEWGDTSAISFRGLQSPGIKALPYRTYPWATLSLKAKKQYLENMKEDLAEAIEKEDSTRERLLASDIRFVEKNLFADELVAYVKLNLAFGLKHDGDFDYQEGETPPPALFYVKDQIGKTLPVTLDDLLNPDRLTEVRDLMGITGDESIDMLEAEDHNYGFMRDPADIIKTFLREARLKTFIRKAEAFSLSGDELAQIGAGEELFFDLEGKSYPSEQALIESLAEKHNVDPEMIVRLANDVARLLHKEIAKENEFSEVIEETIAFLTELRQTTSELQEIPLSEEEEAFTLPEPQDSFEVPSLDFGVEEEDIDTSSLSLAAELNQKKNIKRFSR